MEIRKTVSGDRQAVITLMKEYYNFYEVDPPNPEKLENLVKLLETKEEVGLQFIAYHEKIAVGFATIYITYSTLRADKIAVMNDLFVTPAFRGKGLGKALLMKCKQYADNSGCWELQWVTAVDNYPAQRLYDSVGGKSSSWLFYSL